MHPSAHKLSNDIVETVREPMLVLDGDLRINVANRSFYQTFKVVPAQTVGRLVYELGNGQWDTPALRKLLDDLLPANGEFNDYQIEHDFPDIGRRTMLLNARRLHDDPDDRSRLILLAIEDVTERRRLERENDGRSRWLEVTLASIGDAVIATDAGACVTFLNPAAEKLTGWSANEAMSKPLLEVFNIVNEKSRGVVESPVSKAIRMGAIVGLANHTILIAKDGTERPIDDSAAPIRDDQGKIVGVVMVFHDITDRRAAEEQKEISEQRYRRLFEAAHDGILILDMKNRRITDVNPFELELLDYPREHFIDKELWEIGVFKDKAESQAAMRKVDEEGSIRFENKPLQDRNGRQHAVEIIANRYQEDHQPVIQCNIRDISARARFDKERAALLANEQASRLEAEAANRAKDTFLATLSHELRTPLNAILGWAVLLRNDPGNEAAVYEASRTIERNARVQTQLIEDVLDVSRIVSGKLRLEIKPCDLEQIIRDAVASVQPAADAKQIDIRVQIITGADRTVCDAARIQQVIWNLLSNAIKFSPRVGDIDVLVERANSMTRITITDQGEGIAPDFLPHVFERFRQSDGSSTRQHGGLGLGLSIVRHLVELHGGTVNVQSEGLGKGAAFIINLPIRALAAAPGDGDDQASVAGSPGGRADLESGGARPRVHLDGLRVLVVDDEPDARKVIQRSLEYAGATVAAADSAAAALKLLETVKPHIIVSDISMPATDGYELMKQIRSMGQGYNGRDLPAIALTAYARTEDRRRALLAGFQMHIAKPVDPNELTEVIASLAGRTGVD